MRTFSFLCVLSVLVFGCSNDDSPANSPETLDLGAGDANIPDTPADTAADAELDAPGEPDLPVDLSPTLDAGADATSDVRPNEDMAAGERELFIELTWQTPGDPITTDLVGTDLNLHFRHPLAIGQAVDPGQFPGSVSPVLIEDQDMDGTPDGWFTKPYDVCWTHVAGVWTHWANVNYYDVTTGKGPETMILRDYPSNLVFRVGVDYWDDKGFGPSTAKVRIFENDVFIAEGTATLVEGDFWQVADYDAATGQVTILGTPDMPLQTAGVTKPQP